MADQVSGYAVLPPQGPVVSQAASHWGSAYILVWVVVIILVIAILAALFMGAGDWLSSDSSSDDRHHGKRDSWNLNQLGGFVVFIVVILFLAWLISSAGCYGDRR